MPPKIIHQTWKVSQLPPDLTVYQRTWQDHHPGWEYRLWTDVDNRAFIEAHYPWFLPIYDHYPLEIMRADAVRYFILHHFGGIYADLDYECLRPFDPLVVDKMLLLGLEPDNHIKQEMVRERSFRRLISNALMISMPGHPFWPHVFRKLVEFRDAPGPLDAAGPFLLTRAYDSYASPESITLVQPQVLFPSDNLTPDLHQPDAKGQMGAYGIHHWHGSWVQPVPPPSLRMQVGRAALRGIDISRSRQQRFWTIGDGFFRKRWETAQAWTALALRYLGVRRPQPIVVPTSIWQKPEPVQSILPSRSPDPEQRYAMQVAPRRKLEIHPRVLILCPVKDAVTFLPAFWQNLRTLSYPHHRLSLAFLESDSKDGTYDFIQKHLPSLRADFASVQAFKQDYGYETPKPRWLASEQVRRRSVMAKGRNQLLARALQDEDWVLWIDVDVIHWPSDVLEQMLAADKDIVTPNCINESGEVFDWNTWKLTPEAATIDWSPWVGSGILQPPSDLGRLHLQQLRHYDLVEIDSVGGTMLLVRADVHREGLIFPTFPYKYLIETEGLAAIAHDMGYSCWGMPNLEIIHP